jgi:hypothetical protein
MLCRVGVLSELELNDTDLGDVLAIHVSEPKSSAVAWNLDVFVVTDSGRFHLGSVTTTTPAAGDKPARTVAFAACPGAIGWRVYVTSAAAPPGSSQAACDVHLSSSKHCGQIAPGVTDARNPAAITIPPVEVDIPNPLPVTLDTPVPVVPDEDATFAVEVITRQELTQAAADTKMQAEADRWGRLFVTEAPRSAWGSVVQGPNEITTTDPIVLLGNGTAADEFWVKELAWYCEDDPGMLLFSTTNLAGIEEDMPDFGVFNEGRIVFRVPLVVRPGDDLLVTPTSAPASTILSCRFIIAKGP